MTKAKRKIVLWYWGRHGGGCRFALELARSLSARDDVELHLSLSEYNSLIDEFRKIGAPLHVIRTYTSWWTFIIATFKIWFVRREFMDYLDKHGITHVFSPMMHLWSPFIVPGLKKRGHYFISTIHDPEPHFGDRISLPRSLIKKEIQYADHVICLSEYVATRLRNLYNYPRHKVTICAHGVFSFGQDYEREAFFETSRSFSFLFFGRILPYKGLPLLLEAFAQLVRDGEDVRLVIAGNGDVSAFVDRLETPGVHAEVRWIDENEIPVFYGNADAVVMPYVSASQSGVWADATAFCKPCVVTPVAGLVEQVEDGVTGVVSKDLTPQALADAMRQVMNPTLYRKLVENLRRIDQREEWDATAEKIVNLL